MRCEEKEASTNIVLLVKIFSIIVLSVISDLNVPLDNIVGPVLVTVCNDLCRGHGQYIFGDQGLTLARSLVGIRPRRNKYYTLQTTVLLSCYW